MVADLSSSRWTPGIPTLAALFKRVKAIGERRVRFDSGSEPALNA